MSRAWDEIPPQEVEGTVIGLDPGENDPESGGGERWGQKVPHS